MGPVTGGIIGAVFFILVFFAALTSSISLMETVVSTLEDKLHWNRRLTCLVVLAGAVLLGLPSALGFGVMSHITVLGMDILTFFDFLSNSVIMPIVALFTAIFVAYFLKPKTVIEEIELSGKFNWRGLFAVVIKYVAPVFIVAILVSSVLNAFGILEI